MTRNTCTIEGCSAFVHGRGWCRMHYMRWHRTGNLSVSQPHIRNENPICSVANCDNPSAIRTWCYMHYMRVWRHGSLLALRQYQHADTCSVKDCNRAYYGKDLCASHYQSRIRDPRRRALKSGAAINDFTLRQWQQTLEDHEYRCTYCGELDENLTQDHVIPLSKGGNHTASNIVPACGSCNSRKNDHMLEEWLTGYSYVN